MAMKLIQEQRQQLNARQMQSLDILILNNQELDAFLTEEYLENPLLDCSIEKGSEGTDQLGSRYGQSPTFRDRYRQGASSDAGIPEEQDRAGDPYGNDEGSIEAIILSQLDARRYSRREWTLMRLLICCLDEDGFFPFEPEEIARLSDYPLETIERCLADLRRLEPVGIFSRDISECLIRQLGKQGITDETVYTMVRDHMPDILNGRLSRVAKNLHVPPEVVRTYLRLIGTLNPHPLAGITQDETRYVVPDIVAAYEHGRGVSHGTWHVELNDHWMGEYRLDDYYLRMMERTQDAELKKYLRGKLVRARFLVDAVERRRNTIVRIAETILSIQEPYFLHGAPLVPMTLEDVALRIEMHPSTVSRAIRDKYLQYRQTLLVKDLFSAPLKGTDISTDEVRRMISELVAQENVHKPLSDNSIALLLKERGVRISRRTVAKYREQLGIPDSRQRGYLQFQGE